MNETECGGGEDEQGGKSSTYQNAEIPVSSTGVERKNILLRTNSAFENRSYAPLTSSDEKINFATAVALPKHEFSGDRDMKELDEQIESLMGRSENKICQSASQLIKA